MKLFLRTISLRETKLPGNEITRNGYGKSTTTHSNDDSDNTRSTTSFDLLQMIVDPQNLPQLLSVEMSVAALNLHYNY